MVRIETVLDGWNTVREDTVQAVLDLPGGDLSFRPAPELMSFGEIARHILDAGHGLTGMLLEGVEDFMAGNFRERVRQLAPPLPAGAAAGEVVEQLHRSMDQRIAQLRGQHAGFFGGMVTRWDGARLTRLEMLQFLKEHELTHRSQLFLYLRLRGVVPPTTRRRMAKQ